MLSEQEFKRKLVRVIDSAVNEDIGAGDFTSLACIPHSKIGRAKLLVKDTGILAGVDFAKEVFKFIDPKLKLNVLIDDGHTINPLDVVFEVEGRVQSILKAERIVLNAMQRMSAIATKTKAFIVLLEGTKANVIDTRKTTPCIRVLEKWAVKIGGGENHRMGLYDMIMLKDNHIDFCGSTALAISRVKRYLKDKGLYLQIIVEVRNLKMISEILEDGGVYRILLDNFTPEETKQAVKLIDGRIKTESSGNINEANIRAYAESGVDYISCGALTHSVSNLDLSLKAF